MGDAPLMELEESWVFGMWPRRLVIFENHIEVRDFELLREKARKISYGAIVRVVVSGAGWIFSLLITIRESKPVLIRGVNKEDGERAKALIEDRMERDKDNPSPIRPSPAAHEAKRLIHALTELRAAGLLNEKEFEIKRREVLKRTSDKGDRDEDL